MKELIGKAITKIYFDKENSFIKFETKDELNCDKNLIYGVSGDCCSESWFSEIVGICNIKPDNDKNFPVVENVIELELGETTLRTRQEVDRVYGYLIILKNHSHLLILHRNSSNGYYGGWCSYYESLDHSYVRDKINFIELKDDYYESIGGKQ